MPIGCINVDPVAYPPETMPCLRCGEPAELVFAGPCPRCAAELHEKFRAEARTVSAEYEPKMNVTPNAVALKD
jgi:hypothetical protein